MPSVMVSGNTCVAQAIIRRWSTPRGRLIDDQNYGLDLTGLLSSALTSQDLNTYAKQAGQEAQKDERVLSASVTLSLIGGVLMVSATIVTANGPFLLVAAVSNVTVTLLQVTP